MKLRHITVFAICAALVAPAAAQDIDAGLAAFEADDYETALEQYLEASYGAT